MFTSALTEDCYPDPYFVTLTADIAYFSKDYKEIPPTQPGDKLFCIPPYNKGKFLEEVFMPEEKYDKLAAVLLNKRTSFCREHQELERPSRQKDLHIH